MPIVKVLSRHTPSFSSLLEYILRKQAKEDPLIFTQNLRSDYVYGWTKEFLENESFRQRFRSDQTYLSHEIISFNSEDQEKLTPEVMQDLMNEYMRLRGQDAVMLGVVHRDTDHVHVHFCVSALKYRLGTSARLQKPELQKLKVSLQEYHRQKYPEISQSFPKHDNGRAYITDRKWQALQREQRNLLKESITGTIRECFSKASTQKEFLELLREQHNLHHYERGGVPTGIEHDNMKFRFSRLLDAEQFKSLPVDVREEEKALAEIRSIREQRDQVDRDEMER